MRYFWLLTFIAGIISANTNQDGFISSIYEKVKNLVQGTVISYGVIGNLTTNHTWYSGFRSVLFLANIEPMTRGEIDTRFILYTREKPNQEAILYAHDLETISNSAFNPNRPTKFIIHGFIQSSEADWMRRMKDGLLDYGDFNVISVNWGQGSLPITRHNLLYMTATLNTRIVGLEIGYMANQLIKHFGVKASDIHLIGHSLGAHVAGYAGEQVRRLGRITGLDPARPFFMDVDMPTWIRLDPTDATFVDVVHTNGDLFPLIGFGGMMPCGHVDFYVNGGYQQPGCSPVDIVTYGRQGRWYKMGSELVACNHLRSIDYYIASMGKSTGNWVAYECANYTAFQTGQCTSCGWDNANCSKFGIEASDYPVRDRTQIQMFLQTGKDDPYLVFQYGVQISLARHVRANGNVYGSLSISIYGDKAELVNTELNESTKFTHGDEYSMFLSSAVDVGNIQRVELHWIYERSIITHGPNSICLFCNDDLYVKSVQVTQLNHYPELRRLEHTFKGCPLEAPYATISHRGKTSFYHQTGCQ